MGKPLLQETRGGSCGSLPWVVFEFLRVPPLREDLAHPNERPKRKENYNETPHQCLPPRGESGLPIGKPHTAAQKQHGGENQGPRKRPQSRMVPGQSMVHPQECQQADKIHHKNFDKLPPYWRGHRVTEWLARARRLKTSFQQESGHPETPARPSDRK